MSGVFVDRSPTVQPQSESPVTLPAERPRLSVLMVSYNTRALTLKALETLCATTRSLSIETILVDNASADGSADAVAAAFPQVKLIRSAENLGFAAGNNLAGEHARGEWLLLLNPDTEVYENAVANLVAFGEAHPEAGIYGGRTVFPDGSLNILSCYNRPTPWSLFCRASGLSALFPASPVFDTERIGAWQRDSVRQVDIIYGCFLLLRKSLWDKLGGFDTSFFMYSEDVDLCLRARKFGARPMFTPDATIMHLVGASSTVKAERLVYMCRGNRKLVERHWSPFFRPFGLAMITSTVWTRMTASALLARLRPSRYTHLATQWGRVWNERSAWQ